MASSLPPTDPAAYPGLPEAWFPWLGIDELAGVPAIDWAMHLDGRSGEAVENLDHKGQRCLFEITHRVGDQERRWFVLIASDDDRPVTLKDAKMTTTLNDEIVPLPVWFAPSVVTVAPAGGAVGPARKIKLPIVAPRLGYSVGVEEALVQEFERRDEAGEATGEPLMTYVATTTKPLVMLLALFLGVQEHRELSTILNEVVKKPSLLGVLFAGGVEMELKSDLTATAAATHTLVDGRSVAGSVFPATVEVNGDLALELEVSAVESVDPVRLVGGLIGLRAQRPGEADESVTPTLIGAKVRSQD
ncbi:MAG: hypothetical protein AAGG01_01260 [Planctomycetota bacterium]